MNKEEFLRQLSNELASLDKNEKEDILYDYEEHFRIGIEEGLTEEEISKKLGEPKGIAKQFKVSVILDI